MFICLKLMLKASVRNHNRTAGYSCESGWLESCRLDMSAMDMLNSGPEWSFGQGYQGYSQPPKATKGFIGEHGNSDLSALIAIQGKPTGPAMSQAEGGASVVVRARESRVHGKGRQ